MTGFEPHTPLDLEATALPNERQHLPHILIEILQAFQKSIEKVPLTSGDVMSGDVVGVSGADRDSPPAIWVYGEEVEVKQERWRRQPEDDEYHGQVR